MAKKPTQKKSTKKQPATKYLCLVTHPGDMTLTVLGEKVSIRPNLPHGCCGVMFLFDKLADLRRYFGKDAEYLEVKTA